MNRFLKSNFYSYKKGLNEHNTLLVKIVQLFLCLRNGRTFLKCTKWYSQLYFMEKILSIPMVISN